MKYRKLFRIGLPLLAIVFIIPFGCGQEFDEQFDDQDMLWNGWQDGGSVEGDDTDDGYSNFGADTTGGNSSAGNDTSGGDTDNANSGSGNDTSGGSGNSGAGTGNGQGDTDSDSSFGAGTGNAGAPLVPGAGPKTANACGQGTPAGAGSSKVIQKKTDCFWGGGKKFVPAAAMEQIVESVNNKKWVHIRLTFDPRFVDNSYGINAIGWGSSLPWDDKKKKSGHTFKDLVGSDHAEMILKDKHGRVVMQFKLDYISEDSSRLSGYGTLGVRGGDGKMIQGQESWILGASSSLHRNLNGCGYSHYTEFSPRTDKNYTPNPKAPKWDYRVVYEVWAKLAPFMPAGFGSAIIDYVHASPSKTGNNTIEVTRRKCPEGDDGKFQYWGDDDDDDGNNNGGTDDNGGSGNDDGDTDNGSSTGSTDGGNNSSDTDDDCGTCTISDTDNDGGPV